MEKPRAERGEDEKQIKVEPKTSVQRLIDAVHDLQLDLLVLPPSPEREAAYKLTDTALPYLEAALHFLADALKKAGGR